MENDDLLTKIEGVKSKIAEFEKDLNINSIDIDRIVVSKKPEILNQIKSYKDKIANIEKEIKENNYPIESEPLLADKKKFKANSNKNIENPYYADSVDKTMDRIKKDAIEVEKINNIVDKLKENISSISGKNENVNDNKSSKILKEDKKAENVDKYKQASDISYINNSHNDIKSLGIEKIDNFNRYKDNANLDKGINKNEIKKDYMNIKSDNNVKITENDLHSISELISKLDELLRSNKELSDQLSQIIKLQKEANENMNNSRTNQLIRKLALFGTGTQ